MRADTVTREPQPPERRRGGQGLCEEHGAAVTEAVAREAELLKHEVGADNVSNSSHVLVREVARVPVGDDHRK